MLIQGITIHLIVLLWWENVQKRRIQLISREWVAQKTYYVGDVRLGREAHTWISKVEPGMSSGFYIAKLIIYAQ